MDDAVSEALAKAEKLYISLDVDSLDPAFAPGTGTPEPGGLSSVDLLRMVRQLALEHDVVGMDVVEVAPAYDVSDLTVNVAHRMVFEALGGMAERRRRTARRSLTQIFGRAVDCWWRRSSQRCQTNPRTGETTMNYILLIYGDQTAGQDISEAAQSRDDGRLLRLHPGDRGERRDGRRRAAAGHRDGEHGHRARRRDDRHRRTVRRDQGSPRRLLHRQRRQRRAGPRAGGQDPRRQDRHGRGATADGSPGEDRRTELDDRRSCSASRAWSGRARAASSPR